MRGQPRRRRKEHPPHSINAIIQDSAGGITGSGGAGGQRDRGPRGQAERNSKKEKANQESRDEEIEFGEPHANDLHPGMRLGYSNVQIRA